MCSSDLNLPNSLTLLRIALIPAYVVFFWMPWHWTNLVAAGIFLLAAITDWLDGYLARKLNQTSQFGAFLDPVADKLMVAAALIGMGSSVFHPEASRVARMAAGGRYGRVLGGVLSAR